MDKTGLRQAIIDALESEYRMLQEAANAARDEATNEESRAEDRYDMRSQSAAYLAAGQAKAAGEVEDALKAYRALPVRMFHDGEPIASGALVALEARGIRSWYFLGPKRGGLEVRHGGETVMVVTPASPLGHQLLGGRVGDFVTIPGRQRAVQHQVVAVE